MNLAPPIEEPLWVDDLVDDFPSLGFRDQDVVTVGPNVVQDFHELRFVDNRAVHIDRDGDLNWSIMQIA